MSETKELKLIIQPKVIDHLGIKMYQKPVDVISEFIANAWDADSETVEVSIEADKITVTDKGLGMTFSQCQDFFLTVGRDRRKDTGKEVSEEKKRPVLGRKGIGKFSGFGIARTIDLTTIAKSNGELTSFEMDINEILEHDAKNEEKKPIKVVNYKEPDEVRKIQHGTVVTLNGVDTASIDLNIFKSDLSRRFLLSQLADDFKIKVNTEDLPESFTDELEFVFPVNFTNEEKAKVPNLKSINDKGWAIESFGELEIKWRIGFYEEPIETEELRGVSIFAKGKVAQKPFYFDLAGGIESQFGLEYMTGQIVMDFIDVGSNDLISTERQRINLQTALGKKIREWGLERIKLLSSIWKKRRSEKRAQELEDKLSGFKDRLDKLPGTERKTIKSVLQKIASFERLGKKRYHDWCNDILTSWERGRLRELITKISEEENVDETKLLEILTESDVLTALNIAESIKTKILAIGELKEHVSAKLLENNVRDHIYNHPWIIHPKWESFQKERSVENLIKDVGTIHLKDDPYNGRVDLALAAGEQLLLLEFMRPGLEIDHDHIDRIDTYVTELRIRLRKQTGSTIKRLDYAYIVADSNKDSELVSEKIREKAEKGIFFLTWEGLIQESIKQWKDYLEMLKARYPSEPRIQNL